MDGEAWQDTCPLYPIKEDGGAFWSDLVLTYNAYDKGILPEPGGLGSQPLKYMAMMALVNSRTSEESRLERDRSDKDRTDKGKRSITEQYLDNVEGANDPLAMADPTFDEAQPQIFKRKNPTRAGVSPDGHAAVPGLVKPRAGIGRK